MLCQHWVVGVVRNVLRTTYCLYVSSFLHFQGSMFQFQCMYAPPHPVKKCVVLYVKGLLCFLNPSLGPSSPDAPFRNCRSTKTQVNPSNALERPKHHQSDQSIILGILGSSWLQRAHVHTSKSSTNYTNWIPFSDRIRPPTGFPNLPVSTLLAGLLNLC